MRIVSGLSIALVIGLVVTARAQEPQPAPDPKPGAQVAARFEAESTVDGAKVKSPINYLLYLPEDYGKKEQNWPLILFLHGAGERGDNLDLVKVHGPPKLVEKRKDFQFVVVSPQCPKGKWWDAAQLNSLVDEIVAKHQIDNTRIYVTGLSMGGYGTWSLAAAYPQRFAACAPICGGGNVQTAEALISTPLWVFHGAKDTSVPLKQSEEMVEAIKAAGGNVKLTVYPEAGHDSWTESYDNPELYKWFLSHQRTAGK